MSLKCFFHPYQPREEHFKHRFVQFCWTPNASPTEEPDTSNHPLPSQVPGSPEVGIVTLPGTATPAGKGDPRGDMQGVLPATSSALELVLELFQVVSSALSPSIPSTAHWCICTFQYLHILWSKESFSFEKNFIRVWLVRLQWHFQMYFVPLLWLRKKRCFSLFDS